MSTSVSTACNPQLCPAVRTDGVPCKAVGQSAHGGYCVGHSPRAAAARRKGGQARRADRMDKRLPARLREIVRLLADGMVEAHDGRITPAQLSAMAAAGRTILAVYQQVGLERVEGPVQVNVRWEDKELRG